MKQEINIDLPGWRQTVNQPNRKEFVSDDGYRFVLNTQGGSVDISVEEA